MAAEKEGNYLKNLRKGMKVTVLTKSHKHVEGVIDDIAARKEFHPDGIMVMLTNGAVGRVQSIVSSTVHKNIEQVIRKGESYTVEFKKSALWSIFKKEQDIQQSKSYDLRTFRQKTSKVIIAKSIAALLNSEGGTLFIGIAENRDETVSYVGIEDDLALLQQQGKTATLDSYKRMIIDDIIRPYFAAELYNHLNQYVDIDFSVIQGKTVCVLTMQKSDMMVFLKLEGKKVFMIRIETESRQLQDEDLVLYCMKRFKA